ncbi:unnamed protein product, partial [Allacma fusca]
MFQNQQSFQFEGGNGQTVTLGPIMTAEDVEKVLVEKMNFFLVPSINALISRVEELTEEIRCVREDLKIYTGTFGTSVSDQQSTLENKVETFGGNLKTFLEKLNVLHHTSNDSLGRSISGNEATSRDPYVTVKIGDHEYPYFMSVGVWRQIAGSSITRTIVRGVLESLHSVKQMREFTLSGKGSSKSSKENTGGVMMTLFENTRKPVPPETVAIAIGVVCKLKDSELR